MSDVLVTTKGNIIEKVELIDFLKSEQHEVTANISRLPIEQGGEISDNLSINPRELTIEIITTNLFGDDRPKQAYNQLLALEQKAVLLDVYTHFEYYSDMLISGINVALDVMTGTSLMATVSFYKPRIIKTETTKARTILNSPTTKGVRNVKRQGGVVAPKPATPKRQSVLLQLASGL